MTLSLLFRATVTVLVCQLTLQTAFPLDLIWGYGEGFIEIESVRKRKALFLSATDVERSLPILIRRDSDAGLFVLCTEVTCLPIYQIDPENFLESEQKDFIRADRVAEALGCRFDVRKSRVTLECRQNPEQFRTVGSGVGDVAPGFRLIGRDTRLVALDELRHELAVVILFVRSLDWDPFSQMLARRLQSVSDSLRAANTQAVIIHGYGKRESEAWQDSLKLSFPLLSDEASAIMRSYDVFDRGALPHPALFLVDSQGTIRYRQVFTEPGVPPDLAPLMEQVAKTRN